MQKTSSEPWSTRNGSEKSLDRETDDSPSRLRDRTRVPRERRGTRRCVSLDKVVQVVVEVLTGMADMNPGRETHRLRAGETGPPLVRESDGASTPPGACPCRSRPRALDAFTTGELPKRSSSPESASTTISPSPEGRSECPASSDRRHEPTDCVVLRGQTRALGRRRLAGLALPESVACWWRKRWGFVAQLGTD